MRNLTEKPEVKTDFVSYLVAYVSSHQVWKSSCAQNWYAIEIPYTKTKQNLTIISPFLTYTHKNAMIVYLYFWRSCWPSHYQSYVKVAKKKKIHDKSAKNLTSFWHGFPSNCASLLYRNNAEVCIIKHATVPFAFFFVWVWMSIKEVLQSVVIKTQLLYKNELGKNKMCYTFSNSFLHRTSSWEHNAATSTFISPAPVDIDAIVGSCSKTSTIKKTL